MSGLKPSGPLAAFLAGSVCTAAVLAALHWTGWETGTERDEEENGDGRRGGGTRGSLCVGVGDLERLYADVLHLRQDGGRGRGGDAREEDGDESGENGEKEDGGDAGNKEGKGRRRLRGGEGPTVPAELPEEKETGGGWRGLPAEEKEILCEQLVRNFQFFGDDGQEKIMDSFVIVVGLGGVGSHCAVSLARSGVGRLRLIDFDRVTVSSLNRHASATRPDVGTPKVEALRRHIQTVVPHCQVEAVESLFEAAKGDELLGPWGSGRNAQFPAFVVDAIDNLVTKTDLIELCVKKGLPVVVSGGAGAKCDPTKFRIDDIANTVEDDLCRSVRVRLKQRGIVGRVFAVYSCEKTERELLPLKDFQEDEPGEFRALKNFRVRIIPVLGALPAIMGQSLAAFVLLSLAKQLPACWSGDGGAAAPCVNKRNFLRLFEALKQYARRVPASEGTNTRYEMRFHQSETVYEFYKGASAVSGHNERGEPVPDSRRWPSEVQAVPWKIEDPERPWESVRTGRMVLLTLQEARRFLENGGGTLEGNVGLFGKETVERVDTLVARLQAQVDSAPRRKDDQRREEREKGKRSTEAEVERIRQERAARVAERSEAIDREEECDWMESSQLFD